MQTKIRPKLTDRCVDAVMKRIGASKVVKTPIKLQLDEIVSSTQVNDDFQHEMDITITVPNIYNGHPRRTTLMDYLTLPNKDPVGKEILSEIKEKLEECLIVDRNFHVSIYDKHANELAYSGYINIEYNNKQE